MTNELGNIAYKYFTQELLHTWGRQVPNDVLDFIIEITSNMKLYNLSDVHIRSAKRISSRLNEFIDGRRQYTINNRTLPDFPVFSYNVLDGNPNVVHVVCGYPLDSNRYIYHTGMVNIRRKEASVVSTIKVTDVLGNLEVSIGEISIINAPKPQEEQILSTVRINFEIFTETFNTLFKQEDRSFKCYTDSLNSPRINLYLKKSDKQVIKVADKPILIVLRDDEYLNNNIKRYRRKGGNIQFSFSWIVRGHWRKLHNPDSLGYGMMGERVEGMTYIKSYVKGDKNAPLIKREVCVLDRRTHA